MQGNADRILAIKSAHANGYVHRDVSEPNIVLFRHSVGDVRRGYLIDWELASEVCEGHPMEARDYCRTVSFHCCPRCYGMLNTRFSIATGNDCIRFRTDADGRPNDTSPTQPPG